MPNRLAHSQSPYLLAHRDNPIDWYPWGAEAFEEAKRRGVPVLVSIGYHTCHWCHVMARESFSDPQVAAIVNRRLVSVKVDREEYPEVDSYYMLAAQAFTEHLGWPLNVFVTPEGETFYAATYLPPTARDNHPSFLDVVNAVGEAWESRRADVMSSAEALATSLRTALSRADSAATSEVAIDWDAVCEGVLASEDRQYGGFRGDNKFPMAPVIEFLLDTSPRQDTVALANRMLGVMASTELRDPVEGGFFRYATRPDWTVPHYERMLTDNALLLSCYARAGRVDIAADLVSFLKEVMAVTGGLASSQHSESVIDDRVVEGGYYHLDKAERLGVEPPELDEKVVTGWMGLVLAGLAHAGKAGVDGSAKWGEELARTLLSRHRPSPGKLIRLSINGEVSDVPATLDDYGGLAGGLMELGLATGEAEWCVVGKQLVDECVEAGGRERLAAPGGGDPLIRRLSGGHSDTSEGATPSGEALIAKAALAVAALTGDESYRELARLSVAPGIPSAVASPLGVGGYLQALWRVAGENHVVVVVEDDSEGSMRRVGNAVVAGRATVITVTTMQARAFREAGFDLFQGRDEQQPVAYVCRGFVCDQPDYTAAQLHDHLVALGVLIGAED